MFVRLGRSNGYRDRFELLVGPGGDFAGCRVAGEGDHHRRIERSGGWFPPPFVGHDIALIHAAGTPAARSVAAGRHGFGRRPSGSFHADARRGD